jgi:hypothetical protein
MHYKITKSKLTLNNTYPYNSIPGNSRWPSQQDKCLETAEIVDGGHKL